MSKTLEKAVKDLDPQVASQALIFAALSADELEAKGGLKVPRKTYIGQKAIELASVFKQAEDAFHIKIQKGYAVLFEKMHEIPSDLQRIVVTDFLKAQERILRMTNPTPQLEENIKEFLPCNSFEEALGFSNQTMDWIYQTGVDLFTQSKLEEASGIFHILLALNNQMPNYWIALGLIEKQLEHYEEALQMFDPVILFEPENPIARYHSAEIYLNLNRIDEALIEISALKTIAQHTQDKNLEDAYTHLHQQATQKRSSRGDVS